MFFVSLVILKCLVKVLEVALQELILPLMRVISARFCINFFYVKDLRHNHEEEKTTRTVKNYREKEETKKAKRKKMQQRQVPSLVFFCDKVLIRCLLFVMQLFSFNSIFFLPTISPCNIEYTSK